MQNIIVAWVNDPSKFEEHVPLKFIGERNLRLNYGNDFHVVFLEGFRLLSPSYAHSLRGLGYNLIDAHDIYMKFDQEFAALNRFGNYEKKCFLRWLVIKELFPNENIIHYDGDIVLNESLEKIVAMAKGLTFVLNGCPAFTIVSDSQWFKAYEIELRKFITDIEGYSEIAWQERKGWEASYFTKAAGSFFRKLITSDQDFISHLIHTGRLPQSDLCSVYKAFDGYLLIQNPLAINLYVPFIPLTYKRLDGVDYFFYERFDDSRPAEIYKKRMLFWHMQSCFNFYLARSLFRSYIPIINFINVSYSNKVRLWDALFHKKINQYFGHASRLYVYRYFFGKGDFSVAMNNSIWHTRGVFK